MKNLKYFSSYNKLREFKLIFLLFGVLFIVSCSPAKYVPEGETLLDKSVINIDNSSIKKSDLVPYIKQSANKKIFGAKFHLGLYNLSNIEKDRWPHNWLRNIGEEPVVFDPFSAEKSSEQIEDYLSSKGFFDASVSSDIFKRKSKTELTYNIETESAYRVRRVLYNVEDSAIMNLFFLDTINCLIRSGQVYDFDIVQAERQRLERFIKDLGYFNFSKDNIYFTVDFSAGDKEVDIHYEVRRFLKYNQYGRAILSDHPRYRIKDIFIYSDFDTKLALDMGNDYYMMNDTTEYGGYYFISDKERQAVNKDLIIQSLYIEPGDLFQLTDMERSQEHLSSLQAFRLVNVRYEEAEQADQSAEDELSLNCIIQLTPAIRQEFRVELEGTNSAGNLGGAVNLIYQHKNLFRGAERLNIKLKGAYETLTEEISGSRSTQEYGFETSLTLPLFLFPFLENENFIKKYNPKTVIKAAYNFQRMPVYTRTIANATYGYSWRAGSYRTHTINPLQLNVVKLPFIDESFEQRIDTSSYLAYSYKDVFLLGGNYIYVFNNQNIKKSKDYWYIKLNGELAGNLLALAYKTAAVDPEGETYEIFGQPFAQFVRADVDIRYNRTINDVSSIVYRSFVGVGIPYGNSIAVPFEKQYFSGGANSIRGWQVRSLGPGSYTPVDSSFFNQTADIKLELNMEYRFKLFWILEGALFVDAGNIWTFHEDSDRPGSQFRFDKFYKDIAIGSGLGLRFNLNFIIIRTDLGMKVRDPQLADNPKWILQRKDFRFRDNLNLSFSIGYPF